MKSHNISLGYFSKTLELSPTWTLHLYEHFACSLPCIFHPLNKVMATKERKLSKLTDCESTTHVNQYLALKFSNDIKTKILDNSYLPCAI
jgi:hypothetical protein